MSKITNDDLTRFGTGWNSAWGKRHSERFARTYNGERGSPRAEPLVRGSGEGLIYYEAERHSLI